MKLEDIPDTTCSCETCADACLMRPCWATPEEVEALLEAGYGDRLWVDYWADAENIYLLSPAGSGYEGGHAPSWPEGSCTFLTDDGLCELHDKGLKPSEGRKTGHQSDPDVRKVNIHKLIADTWDTPEGRALIERVIDRYDAEIADDDWDFDDFIPRFSGF